jgi:hypothetical protein
MSNQLRTILAAVLCAVALFGEPVFEWVKNNVDTVNVVPDATVNEPSLENKELVDDIVKIDFSKEDADLVSCFFLELADVVGDDDKIIKTTGQFASFNVMAGILHFDTEFAGKYEGFGDAVEYAVQNAIGLENQSLTDSKRQDLVDVLEAVAWGVNQ